jgi:hypothetical protein
MNIMNSIINSDEDKKMHHSEINQHKTNRKQEKGNKQTNEGRETENQED